MLAFRTYHLTLLLCGVCIFLHSENSFSQGRPSSRRNAPSSNKRMNTRIVAGTSASVSSSSNTLLSTSSSLSTRPTLRINTSSSNTLSASVSDSVPRSKSGIDTIIVFSAQDSMRYFVKDRHLRLRGGAFVKNRASTLQAEIIDVFFDKGYMKAETARDSLGRVYGVPKFTDGSESYYGAALTYNFRTQRGTISLAEAKMGEGFFFGEKIKRVSENTFFMQDGCYTTCNKTHPHFYFKSPRMKVITQDRVFADPLIFYIEDVPIAAVPFGLFMEIGGQTGRRSGFIIPQVFISSPLGSTTGRGIAFENLGYYFAINDNLDAKVTASFFTKGGAVGRVQGNYAFGPRLRGSVDASYGYTRFSPTDPFSEQWSLAVNHNQQLTPFTSIQGNLNFSSPGFIRQTQFDLSRRVTQTLNSSFSVNHRFDNGIPLGVSYARVQNLGNNEVTTNVNVNTSIPQVFPLRNLVPRDSWLADVSFNYGVNGTANWLQPADSLPNETLVERERRKATAEPFRSVIRHTPSINISPRLGYFTITPNISYRENWYFRRIEERRIQSNTTPSITVDKVQQGFFREYSADFGLSLGTTLYGVVNPRILGLNSLRHTLRPSLGFTFSPDVSVDELGMVGRVKDVNGNNFLDQFGRSTTYSRFALDQGGVPIGRRLSLDWGLSNNFEAKIATSDTSESVVQLLALNLNGGVNFAADSLQWSTIGVSFSNTLGGVINFSGGATFDVYDQDTIRFGESRSFSRVNRFLLTSGKGLARLTNAGFSLSYSVGSNGGNPSGQINQGQQTQRDTSQQNNPQNAQEAALGERFRQRMDNAYDDVDLFGDRSPGVRPLDISWNSSYNAAFNYAPSSSPGFPATLSALIAANFSMTFEKNWRLATGFSFDAISGQFNAPSVSINKDLHCWEMSLTWQPVGQSQGFIFRIGMKAAQLRDIQVTRQQSPLFRQ